MAVTVLRIVVMHDSLSQSTQFQCKVLQPTGFDSDALDPNVVYTDHVEMLWEDDMAALVRDEIGQAIWHFFKHAGMPVR